jgi:hypothetical protein
VELSALESRLSAWRDSREGARTQPDRDRAPEQRAAERDRGCGR